MLTGACMSRAGLNRRTRLATAMLVVSAEISDVDVLWDFKGQTYALQHHRGWTHSFVGVPAMAALALLTVWAWNRLFRRRANTTAQLPVRWRLLFLFGCLGALSHILLDYTTPYGIRFMEPFSYRWYSWDIVSIIEPVLLILLFIGLFAPTLFSLINEEIGARNKAFRGRGWSIFALIAVCVVWAVRDYEHRRAVAELDSRLYEGADPLRVSAYPYMWDPFKWHGIVETHDFFDTMIVDSRQAQVDAQGRARIYYKPEQTPATLAAKKSRFGRIYLDWAKYPYSEEERTQSGYIVRFYDLRYRFTDSNRRPLSAAVLLDNNLKVTGLMFGIRSEKAPD
jgi:inner membrane protein